MSDASSDIFQVTKDMGDLPLENAIQTYKLLEAKARAEAATLKTRLAMLAFRPSHLYPVYIYNDGLRWVCEYVSTHAAHESSGLNVIAYGMCPEEALSAFDQLWTVGEATEEENSEEENGEEGCGEVI